MDSIQETRSKVEILEKKESVFSQNFVISFFSLMPTFVILFLFFLFPISLLARGRIRKIGFVTLPL